MPAVFGKTWATLIGKKLADLNKQAVVTTYAWVTLGALIQAWILAHFVTYAAYFYPSYSRFAVGVITALWAWVAFVAIPQGVNTLFAGSRKKLWAINTGYFLVVIIINGVILSVWR
jgi:hypothetical protein